MNQVQIARQARDKAQMELVEAVAAEYQPGHFTYYKHGYHLVPCRVVCTSGERVKVCGGSGKEYWIDSSRMAGGR